MLLAPTGRRVASANRRVRTAHLCLATLMAGAATLGLAACSADATGHVGVAVDPAGRLLAVVALCDNQYLESLTFTDETTGTSTTVRPQDSPTFGATIILTGPIGDPRPEGVLDLLDRRHVYSLAGTTTGADSDEQTGTLAPVTFTLDAVVTEKRLRAGSVLAGGSTGAAMTERDAFLARARQTC